MHQNPIIEIKDLSKSFGSFKAVDNISLTVNQGDIYGFLGPNGAGKSTTIRMMMSLIQPSSGYINIFGMPLSQHRISIARRIGAIVEKPDFYLYLTAAKNLEFLGKLSGADVSKKSIDAILDTVGLLDRASSKVKTFSYGMKQRLGIAQALLHNPDLIVLDEPTNGLDPVGVKEIRELILSLSREQNKTIFLSSHILSEVEIIATNMVIINKGCTIVEGNVQELLNKGLLKVNFTVDKPKQALECLNTSRFNSSNIVITDTAITIETEQSFISDINSLLVENDIKVEGIQSTRSLEEYFLSITKP